MLRHILGSYSAAGLASPAQIPVTFPLIDGTIDEITIFTGSNMVGGDATFNFWLNGVPLMAGVNRWIVANGTRTFPKTGLAQAMVEGDSLVLYLEEITGGIAEAPLLILIKYDDGINLVDDTAYDAITWNDVVDIAPSKNAMRDKIEAMITQIASDIAAAIAGLSWKEEVTAATAVGVPLPANTYANGSSGVGAALTGNANGALAAQDGITLTAGQRLLVKDEASGLKNGIYELTQVGTGSTPYILTRVTDADVSAEIFKASVYVAQGTENGNTQWTCSNNSAPTMGTTAITFAQFNAGSFVSDVVYGAGWNGDTTNSPSKNAVYDKIEALPAEAQTLSNKNIVWTAVHGTDDTFTGETITGLNNSGGVTQWDLVYLNSSSQWVLADANGTGTYPARGIVTATAGNGAATSVLVQGTVRNDGWTWTPGALIYLDITAGGLTQTAPSASGEVVQEVGFALDADRAYFNFDSSYVTLV